MGRQRKVRQGRAPVKKEFRRTTKSVEDDFIAYQNYRKAVGKRSNKHPAFLTEESLDMIYNALVLGHQPEFACASAGMSYARYLDYLRRGRADYDRLSTLDRQGVPLRDEDYSIYFEFFVKTQQALFECQDKPLKSINTAMEAGDWRAAAHFLERRFPDKWGRKIEAKIESTETKVQTVIVTPQQIENANDWNAMVAGRVKRLKQVEGEVVEGS